MISPKRWARVKPIVQAALDLPPSDLEGYLDRSCADDPELRDEVRRLLRACGDSNRSLSFLESPAAELAAPLLRLEGSSTKVSAELSPGADVGPYTIEGLLGRGGMGIVYLARDGRLDRRVALKVLPDWLAMSDFAQRRFVQEAKAASRRDHPNIGTIYEIGESADGRLYIAMAHYEGETLRERIARGPLDLAPALDLGRQIAQGLGAAHDNGIVHRDIKPGNVMVTPDQTAVILDFGAALVAGPGSGGDSLPIGTVAYMSPEQTRQRDVDSRSDVWSFGVMLYEMLTGRHPFPIRGTEAVMDAIRHAEPESISGLRPDLPDAVVEIVERCLQRAPDGRYRDGAELAEHLRLAEQALRDAANEIRAPGRRIRLAGGAVVGLVALAGVLGYALSTDRSQGAVVPAASAIVVLPFTPVVEDSALRRLGRELVVTLSTSLDDVGEIHTAQALAVLARIGEEEIPFEQGAELAGDLGARSFLHGTLVRTTDGVRVEMDLVDATDRRFVARASATGPIDDIGALSDSLTLALLGRIWRGGDSPAPDPAALTTRSVAALRAYVEGEVAFAGAEHRDAVEAFERAFAHDSTFWLAYWRSIYPRAYEGSEIDPELLARIVAHRDELPDPDRLMVEAEMAGELAARMDTLRLVTSRFPNYWPGWYAYADELVHNGPYLGTGLNDARVALERLVALNPNFAEGWRHLLLIAVLQRDTSTADRALAGLERFESADAFLFNPDNMTYFRALHALLRTQGELSEQDALELARVVLRVSPPVSAETAATGLLFYGFPRAQLQQLDAMSRLGAPRELVEAGRMGRAYAWASRGAWDSAQAALGEWVNRSGDYRTSLRAYGLAASAAAFGAVSAETAAGWRPDQQRFFLLATPDDLAELSWLDGIVAYAGRDSAGIDHARERLTKIPASDREHLVSSLDAFRRHVTGDRHAAARRLAALEWEFAQHDDRAAHARHPHRAAVHRLLAARWLLEAGDTLQAARLLPWSDAIGGPASAANQVAAPLALYERARMEEARGRQQQAVSAYRAFLERYDRPPVAHESWVEVARGALVRTPGSGDRANPEGH
jgi:TolB-like protein